MTLSECAQAGHTRVRKSYWADPNEYLEIKIIKGHLAPWGRLHSPNIEELAKDDDPVIARDFQEVLDVSTKPLLIATDTASDWEPYAAEEQSPA